MKTTTVFQNGNSQAVRIPKEFRLTSDRVEIRREGGVLILSPLEEEDWPAGYIESLREGEDDSFDRPEQGETEKRLEL